VTVWPDSNPILALYEGQGRLVGRDRDGLFGLTGSGAVRYAPAEGARINYQLDPRFRLSGIWGDYNAVSTIVDDDEKGRCRELYGAIDDGGMIGFPFATFPNPAPVVTMAFDVKLMSGQAIDWDMTFIEYYPDYSGPFVPHRPTFTPTAEWSRVVLTFNLTLATWGRWQFRRNSNFGALLPSTIRLANMTVEVGVTDGSWFDADGGYVDPITGIVGTETSKPGLSSSVPWIEEATTNLIGNPSFEVDTGGWGPQASPDVFERDTTVSKYGGASLHIVTSNDQYTGAVVGWTSTVGTYTGSFSILGDAGDKVRVLFFDGIGVWGLTEFTLVGGGEWEDFAITAAVTTAGGNGFYIDTGDTPQTVDWHIDGVQIENKAYRTSYADGSIGVGYTWNGAAHGSASQRAMATVSFPSDGRVSTPRGSAVVRYCRNTDKVANYDRVWDAGHYGSPSGDSVGLFAEANNERVYFYVGAPANGGQELSNISNVLAHVWHDSYVFWTIDDAGHSADGVNGATVARIQAPTGQVSADHPNVALGSYGSLGPGSHPNALICPIAFYDRPLTADELATVTDALEAGVTDLWDLLEAPEPGSAYPHLRTVVLSKNPLRLLTIPLTTNWKDK
jgi:hypothetical protein